MKKLINLLQFFSISLTFISLFLLFFSLITLLDFDNSISFANTVSNIYKALATYSGIYKFTFIVCAFWATLRQLEISKNNYENTSSQIQFVQDDILDKRNKDVKNETLKQCNLYVGEIQKEYYGS